MSLRRPFSIPGAAAAVLVALIANGAAVPAHADELQVKLFLQPCVMKGPFPRAVLEQIHSIGPEELIPGIDGVVTQTTVDQALTKLERADRVPESFARYTEKSIRRFRALRDYFTALNAKGSPKAFVSLTEKHLVSSIGGIDSNGAKSKWESTVKAFLTPATGKERILEPELREHYLKLIEADPEEEFHNTIGKLQIQYACNFDPAVSPSPRSAPAPKPSRP